MNYSMALSKEGEARAGLTRQSQTKQAQTPHVHHTETHSTHRRPGTHTPPAAHHTRSTTTATRHSNRYDASDIAPIAAPS